MSGRRSTWPVLRRRSAKARCPSHPPTGIESAEERLRLLGEMRAGDVLPELSSQQRDEALRNADCLAGFLRSPRVQDACEPLRAYGLTSVR